MTRMLSLSVTDRPVDASDDITGQPRAICTQHADVDQVRAGATPPVYKLVTPPTAAARDDAGDVGAMSGHICRGCLTGNDAHIRDDSVSQRGVRRDSGVDDRDANPLTRDAWNGPMPSSPDVPARTWSAPVDLFDTVIVVRTRESPER